MITIYGWLSPSLLQLNFKSMHPLGPPIITAPVVSFPSLMEKFHTTDNDSNIPVSGVIPEMTPDDTQICAGSSCSFMANATHGIKSAGDDDIAAGTIDADSLQEADC